MRRRLQFQDLGVLDYAVAERYQNELQNLNVQIKGSNRSASPSHFQATVNHLLFVEHPHVYTLGKSGKENNLLISEKRLHELGATFHHVSRGGDITYHGPGQLVVYPILDLENFFADISKYLRSLEEVVILTLSEFSIEASRHAAGTGVWVMEEKGAAARKICALGVHCSRWVTKHGIGFNINTDLDYFHHIVPCGIRQQGVTSMKYELGKTVEMEVVKESFKRNFCSVFEAEIV